MDCLAQTARKSATSRKSTASKHSIAQPKPDEKARGSADPIIVTESEDAPAPSRSKQSQRKSVVPQPKPVNGGTKGKGKAQVPQRDHPIDLEPLGDISDISDVEISIPTPRKRSSPNESTTGPGKDESIQRKLLQASPSAARKSHPFHLFILLQSQKVNESLRKQIEELLKSQMDQQQALESWKVRQEASNGGTSSEFSALRHLTLSSSI